MNWEQIAQSGSLPKWPYPVRYREEKEAEVDVLILGGGIAGCWAAIGAARQGVKVAIVEKGATIRSGAGIGVDNWNYTPNPFSKVTPEECVESEFESYGGYTNCISRYISARESYDTLLEMERLGGKIRDTEDEFKGADFRDEKTKFCFRFDYLNKLHFVVWGADFKPALYKECKRLGVAIFDRVQATSLLTVGGRTGTRVVGATGLNNRTGEFHVFKAKAIIDCMSRHSMNWLFSLQEARVLDAHRPFSVVGNGHAMAWRAGAALTMMEKSRGDMTGAPSYPGYGEGSPATSWWPCSIVDADGKEIPWIDRDGKILTKVSERYQLGKGQKWIGERAGGNPPYKYHKPQIIPDITERIMNGEFKLPLYADLPGMPEMERKLIWGVLIGNEGKTKVPVLQTYSESGFDPNKDLLQNYEIFGGRVTSFSGTNKGGGNSRYRMSGELGDAGGLVVDWNLMTTLDGLFAAGDAVFAGNYHHHAATTGRHAGRKAAAFAIKTTEPILEDRQVQAEKDRVYSPVERKEGFEWQEIRSGSARIMQNYCGEYKSEELLKIGLTSLREIEETDLTQAYAGNPHQLGRVIDSFDIITCDQIIMNACLARKASSKFLWFYRLDYPEVDPSDWQKWLTVKLDDEGVKTGELPIDFYGPLPESYEAHNRDYKGWYKSRK
jgi:succinate dehydrogenase/fumarate reductase flavoprotein subunit